MENVYFWPISLPPLRLHRRLWTGSPALGPRAWAPLPWAGGLSPGRHRALPEQERKATKAGNSFSLFLNEGKDGRARGGRITWDGVSLLLWHVFRQDLQMCPSAI